MLVFDRWEIRELRFDIHNLAELWLELQKFPTLFSDVTKGDIRNWISLIKDESYVWYEVFEAGERIGVIHFQLQDDDADLHVVFFDRRPAEKKGLIRFFCKFMFDAMPGLQRISCNVPAIYYGSCRIAMAVGKWEGTRRQAVAIGGKRVDVHLYGLLRQEAYGIPEGQDQRTERNTSRYSGTPR